MRTEFSLILVLVLRLVKATYQLATGRGTTSNGPWENIVRRDGFTTYTPQQAVTGEDFGKYLRVVASYTEAGVGGLGGQRAIATSMYPTILTIGDNNDPVVHGGRSHHKARARE